MIRRLPYWCQWLYFHSRAYLIYEVLVLRPRWQKDRIEDLEQEIQNLIDDPEYAAERHQEQEAIEEAYQRTDPSLPWTYRCCLAVDQVRRAAGGRA
ncbi:FtsB/FtsL family cell division protein [Paludisphaera rhizosphaerae]|uniref:hypothetical protein n=1 Tax=Paludisphaera rhizosphaerae TaxID=2711216 RepID=UPI0013EC06E6|nr:hypothetical protein [Paludisphaera rhizosphaerae]